MPRCLGHVMATFVAQQEQIRAGMQKTIGSMGTMFPFGNAEEVGQQNMAMMERAMSLFTPFYRGDKGGPSSRPKDEEVAALRAEVERLKRELAEAKKAKTKDSPGS